MKVRVASAGTGKTTSLVLRYLELIGQGVPLRRVAGVTFTRAAAAELRQRVGVGIAEVRRTGRYLSYCLDEAERERFDEAAHELGGATLSTIHGFMTESLRLVAPLMGLDPAFGVLGEWEAQAIFEEEVRSLLYLAQSPEHGLHGAALRLGEEAEPLLRALFAQRSLTERFEIGPSDPAPSSRALQALFEAAYQRFEARLGAAMLPPSEVERRALKLIRTPQALARLAERYRLVLVDEFQDVNPLQGAYFEALERSGMLIEVVGDPKQSIYGFRNADVGVFRRALARAALQGDVLEPLVHTRRHARVLSRFLNHLTSTLAQAGLGFGPEEAPLVETRGVQEEVMGRVELHWVRGEAPIGELRAAEARVLAERLRALHEEGLAEPGGETRCYDYCDMAVLARSYAGLAQVESALLAEGLPYVLLQGRGYFERSEVRDLYHALKVGVEAKGFSLAAWLRGPYAQLSLADLDAILSADDPEKALERHHPEVFVRLKRIRAEVRGAPLAALKFLIREPFIGGKRYVEFLDSRERENVDALLFTVAQGPPGDLELLLERLERLSRQADAGDVPQTGEGIQLLTVHKAKGLEWPLVAVFDLGRMVHHQPQALYLDPETGRVHPQDSPDFEATRERVKAREEEESYRLFYVAASRARDVLMLTGSVKGDKLEGWMNALAAMNLGPGSKPYARPDFVSQVHPYAPVALLPTSAAAGVGLEPASWIDRRFALFEHPPVSSPSRVKQEAAHEPLPFTDPDEGENLPGRAATVGTLTHYAVSQNWSAGNPVHLENLRAQEVMFPFTPEEQDDILSEVKLLLGNYESLLGDGLPALNERSEDHPELPMALPIGTTVWQGIIDRLYCAGGEWFLEDYKTDQEVEPEKYHFQLAVYLRAIREVRGVTPKAQLVFLRARTIVRLSDEDLLGALEQALEHP